MTDLPHAQDKLDGLAIVAGAGDLPRLIAENAAREGIHYCVVSFSAAPPDWIARHPHFEARFEKLGKFFKALRSRQCSTIVMAGKVERPSLNPVKFDKKTWSLAPKILPNLKRGDGGTLGIVTTLLEAEGFRVVGAHEILSDALVQIGCQTEAKPSEEDEQDIRRAQEIAKTVGEADVGQAVAVAQGICIGVESIQGTDAMLRFIQAGGRSFLPEADGARGVLHKAPKPGQDWRVDLPVIGVETVRGVADAGLAGIAVAAGGVMIIDREATVREANTRGLFLLGIEVE